MKVNCSKVVNLFTVSRPLLTSIFAERVGFEPTEPFPVLQISSLTQSTNSAISPIIICYSDTNIVYLFYENNPNTNFYFYLFNR